MRHINQEGLGIVKESEGLRLQAYICPAGKWTIGWGHTGSDVLPDSIITLDRAEVLLGEDINWAEIGVSDWVTVPLTDNQFSALVSFVFNIGIGAFRRSTLLRKLNEGYYSDVPVQMRKWIKGGGQVLSGLIVRREKEVGLWEKR